MNALNPALELETDAPGGDLRPCKQPPRPIPYPETSATTMIGGQR